MIPLQIVRTDPERVRASQRARGEDPAAVDTLLAADARRRAAISVADQLRSDQKAASRKVRAATGDERTSLVREASAIAEELKSAESEQAAAETSMRTAHLALSNIVADEAPIGGEDDFIVLDKIGEIPTFDFVPKDHIEIGKNLGALDIERGAKVSGSRFYFLTGPGAQLEIALINLAMEQASNAGFTPMIAPALVKPEAMEGTGYLGTHAEEVYRLERDDLYLVGTSEVALAASHANEILDKDLPKRYAGFSSCFRREAGSHGKDTRGVFRVHWFDKVEMFSFAHPDDAVAEHERLLEWQKEFLGKLELPYRVVDIASADLGSSAVRKFDCEAWFASQGRYRELMSTSNCTTFQAQRLNIRFRGQDGKVAPVATLNGTLCAITRTIACLLETHQQPDGSVYVPKALQPYLGGRDLVQATGHARR